MFFSAWFSVKPHKFLHWVWGGGGSEVGVLVRNGWRPGSGLWCQCWFTLALGSKEPVSAGECLRLARAAVPF